jgi:transcriptional regulator with XRE-family HTH domain
MEFDAGAFAAFIGRARLDRGWSTRQLARRARISQPYVVALERERAITDTDGPVPTVEVVTKLAAAFGVDPTDLFAGSLRPAPRHVLLVVEDRERTPVEHVRAAAGAESDRWVWAASSAKGRSAGAAADHAIDLHRDGTAAYVPERVSRSLDDELARIAGAISGSNVGFVFADTSAVMSTLADPGVVVAFEHAWADVVSVAARRQGARATFNVCVYELDALRRLPDAVATAVDLVRSHDAVWSARGARVVGGAAATRRVLESLRPRPFTRSEWRDRVDELVADLQPVA